MKKLPINKTISVDWYLWKVCILLYLNGGLETYKNVGNYITVDA